MHRRRLLPPPPSSLVAATPRSPRPPAADPKAESWVRQTLKKMTLEEKVAQLVVPGLNGVYTPLDSEAVEKLERLVRERPRGRLPRLRRRRGPAARPAEPGLRDVGRARDKGEPLAIAVLLNRLQRASRCRSSSPPTSRAAPATSSRGRRACRAPWPSAPRATRGSPRAPAASPPARAAPSASTSTSTRWWTSTTTRRTRSSTCAPSARTRRLVGRMATAYLEGIQAGGMLATAKHFPGHGDTATDTHLDLAVIEHPRSRLDAVELVPFRAVIDAGIDAVMSSHIRLPALDPTEGLPATLSRPILTGLLRQELRFDGLVFTDSMSMHAISRRFPPEKAAAMAVGGRGRRRPRPARPRGRAPRHPRGRRAGRDPARPGRPVGRAHPAREGPPRPPPRADGGRRGGAGRARGPGPRRRWRWRSRRRRSPSLKDDRGPGAAAPARERPRAAPVGDRLRERLARGGPGTGARPGAEEALRGRDRGRGLRPHDRGRDGPAAGARPPVGRGRRRRPTSGSPPTAGAWASRRRRPRSSSSSRPTPRSPFVAVVLRQPLRGRPRPEAARPSS